MEPSPYVQHQFQRLFFGSQVCFYLSRQIGQGTHHQIPEAGAVGGGQYRFGGFLAEPPRHAFVEIPAGTVVSRGRQIHQAGEGIGQRRESAVL